MNVVIINRSDTTGGAAIVARRLTHALRHEGVKAMMLVACRNDIDVYAQPLGTSWEAKRKFLLERLGIFLRNGFRRDTLFKIDTATRGFDPKYNMWIRQADVVVLNWINQGTLSLGNIKRLAKMGKPLVWIMHDMWNCTGVCHHAGTCDKFTGTCQSCPLLPGHGNDLATRTQRRKAQLYRQAPIHFVAVSNWLAQQCRKSSLMKDCDVTVLPNAFPIESYPYAKLEGDDAAYPSGKVIVAMGAARLDDPIKGFGLLAEATRYIAQHKPGLAGRLHLVLFGNMRQPELLQQLALPYTWLGSVENSQVSDIYRHSDVVLSTSRYETLPTTLIEGMASGCVAVTTGNGGQPDIVDHLSTGYIATSDAASLAAGLEWAAALPASREALHQAMASRFDASVVAKRYIDFFNKILNDKNNDK